MTHTISFRRPEKLYVLSNMSVPPEANVGVQIRRLLGLGYQIVEVTPPIDGYSPDDVIVDLSPPGDEVGNSLLLRTPGWRMPREAAPWSRRKLER